MHSSLRVNDIFLCGFAILYSIPGLLRSESRCADEIANDKKLVKVVVAAVEVV